MSVNAYEVVWPRGRKVQQELPYATRLDDLSGKRIAALWNGAFRSSEIFPILERELSRLKNCSVIPSARLPTKS